MDRLNSGWTDLDACICAAQPIPLNTAWRCRRLARRMSGHWLHKDKLPHGTAMAVAFAPAVHSFHRPTIACVCMPAARSYTHAQDAASMVSLWLLAASADQLGQHPAI